LYCLSLAPVKEEQQHRAKFLSRFLSYCTLLETLPFEQSHSARLGIRVYAQESLAFRFKLQKRSFKMPNPSIIHRRILRFFQPLIPKWERELGGRLIYRGSLATGMFVGPNSEPAYDVDFGLLVDDPCSMVPKIENVTGAIFHKWAKFNDWVLGPTLAPQHEVEFVDSAFDFPLRVQIDAYQSRHVEISTYWRRIYRGQISRMRDIREQLRALPNSEGDDYGSPYRRFKNWTCENGRWSILGSYQQGLFRNKFGFRQKPPTVLVPSVEKWSRDARPEFPSDVARILGYEPSFGPRALA